MNKSLHYCHSLHNINTLIIIDKCKIDPRKESINLHVVGDNEDLPSIKFSLT